MNIENIKKLELPKKPGCYFFKDKDNEIIYIGKAADLRSRVLSYWRESTSHSPAKYSMMKKIKKIDWIEVESEIEALLLESNLIKKHKPTYNIVMRDDKRHVYIKVSTEDEYPRVFMTRQLDRAGKYFGPFVSVEAVRETLKVVRKIWPYRSCKNLPKKVCLYYRIGKCPGPCEQHIEKSDYDKIIRQIILFLDGKKKRVAKDIEKEIKLLEKSVIANEAERSVAISRSPRRSSPVGESTPRDDIIIKINSLKYRLINLRKVLDHSNILSLTDKYASDVVELAKVLGLKNIPNRIEGYDISNIFGKEAVGSMVVFNDGEPNKSEYRKFKIKNEEGGDTGMLKEMLERRLKHSIVNFCHPGLVPGSCDKLSTHLDRSKRIPRNQALTNQNKSVILEGAPCLPAGRNATDRISGTKASTNQHKKSVIARNEAQRSDAAISNVLKRSKENWPSPDLIIIDGGKGQLNAVLRIIKKYKLDIPVIAVSKGQGLRSAKAPDKIFFPGEKKPLELPLSSPALHIIKRVRDEAHRFAITYHRKLRKKRTFK